MVEHDRWCPEILQQIAAIQPPSTRSPSESPKGHVEHCMAQGADDGSRAEMTAELMQALGRIVR